MAKKIASKYVEGMAVRIEFDNGKNVVLDIGDLTEEVRHLAIMHGISQKLGDSYAGCGGDVEMAWAQCTAIRDQLLDGNWNAPGRDGRGRQGKQDLIRVLYGIALQEGHNVTESGVEKMIEALDKKQLAGLKKDPQVAKGLAEIELTRARERMEQAMGEGSLGDLLGLAFGGRE